MSTNNGKTFFSCHFSPGTSVWLKNMHSIAKVQHTFVLPPLNIVDLFQPNLTTPFLMGHIGLCIIGEIHVNTLSHHLDLFHHIDIFVMGNLRPLLLFSSFLHTVNCR